LKDNQNSYKKSRFCISKCSSKSFDSLHSNSQTSWRILVIVNCLKFKDWSPMSISAIWDCDVFLFIKSPRHYSSIEGWPIIWYESINCLEVIIIAVCIKTKWENSCIGKVQSNRGVTLVKVLILLIITWLSALV